MKLKKYLLCLLVPMLLIAAGCSALQAGSTTTNKTFAQSAQTPGASNMANQPIENKLAIGTLKLEGSPQAVTADQARTLLPLWKAVKSLSASSTASADEMAALYTQIQEAMTADQIAAIKTQALTPADTQALMQQYNIQAPAGMPQQSATRVASSSGSTNQGGGPGGPQDGGGSGGPPPDGGIPGGGASGAQSTPQAGQTPRAPRVGGGMNSLFVEPLITLLEARANS